MSKDEKWAGDREEQIAGAQRVFSALEGMHPVDAIGALETAMGNIVCDYATDFDDAERGLDKIREDMRQITRGRFPGSAPQ